MPASSTLTSLFRSVLPLAFVITPLADCNGDDGATDDAAATEGAQATEGTDGSDTMPSDPDASGDTGETLGPADSSDSGPPTDDTGPAPDDCPDELFVAPAPDPANAAYPDPELEAFCTDTELVVRSNGIPGYEFQATTPNDLQAQSHEWRVPLAPVEAAQASTIPLLGVAALSVNGMPIFGPNEAAMPDPYGDPIYNGLMDFCLGHTAMGGEYHYHGLLVECVVGEVPAGEPSPIIGFALDGYPIYGPVGCLDEECSELVTFSSGWVQTGDPSTYAWDNHEYVPSGDPTVLDECNGRTGPDGSYRYHATDTFPYVLGCYHGEAVAGM